MPTNTPSPPSRAGWLLSILAGVPLVILAVNLLGGLILVAPGQGGMRVFFLMLLSVPAALLAPVFWLVASVLKLPLGVSWAWFSALIVVVSIGIGLVVLAL
ncbi:hypothetical protein [Tautonia plasticadhaerens]|uniref:Uncharacterized protein n=1 Tax=Tautonia plasticadhaerens TaxID=2527974 RepID=A0A518HDL9_9BACT|nr:hypothetical protein [Tautonia plasticadhaerens]QDV38954.1 hypothetical protein ElP_69140 [Tautonia plasticadhaerens]